jgi:hypothetical protein
LDYLATSDDAAGFPPLRSSKNFSSQNPQLKEACGKKIELW